jgi:hypothetical protein
VILAKLTQLAMFYANNKTTRLRAYLTVGTQNNWLAFELSGKKYIKRIKIERIACQRKFLQVHLLTITYGRRFV